MKKFKVWDKVEAINLCDAQTVIREMNIKESDEIVLIYDDITDIVTEIQFKDTLRSIYQIVEEDVNIVGEKYLERRKEEENNKYKDILTLEKQQEQIKSIEFGLANVEYSLMMGGLL